MTPAQQKKAISLLKECLRIKEAFDDGYGVNAERDDRHTTQVRTLLIELGAVPDRRKKK